MGLWYSISGILLLILFVVIGIEGIGLYSLFAIFIPYVAVLPLRRRFYLPCFEMGEFAGSLPYPDGLRTTEIALLDQSRQSLTAPIPQEVW